MEGKGFSLWVSSAQQPTRSIEDMYFTQAMPPQER